MQTHTWTPGPPSSDSTPSLPVDAPGPQQPSHPDASHTESSPWLERVDVVSVDEVDPSSHGQLVKGEGLFEEIRGGLKGW